MKLPTDETMEDYTVLDRIFTSHEIFLEWVREKLWLEDGKSFGEGIKTRYADFAFQTMFYFFEDEEFPFAYASLNRTHNLDEYLDGKADKFEEGYRFRILKDLI